MVKSPREEERAIDERAIPAGDAMAVIDARGIVTGWSEGARRLTGHPAAQIVGQPAARLVAGEPDAVRHALFGDGHAVVDLTHPRGR
ncbi:PAS domain-containing protein [Streptomyces cavernae]|uniref:PAS domain-containing protein n=1 Tax=Streptomyces cavernae TaxID=2259034 RepID=UPI000FEC02C1